MRNPKIHCCNCGHAVQPRFTHGDETHPERDDMANVPLFVCDDCGSFTSCQRGEDGRFTPKGVIPSKEIVLVRNDIRNLVEEIWQVGNVTKRTVYGLINYALGRPFSLYWFTTVEEGKEALAKLRELEPYLVEDLSREGEKKCL